MEIKVFGMTNCAGCDTVKAVLKQKGIEYHYYDVMHHADMGTASEFGIRSVPTVVVERGGVEYFVTGSTKESIDSILSHIGV